MNNLGPLIVNLDGLTLSNSDRKLLSDDLVGGVILFSNNYESLSQLQKLIHEIRSIKSNILISTDHEGGRVQRFHKDFTSLPSFNELSKLDPNTREKLSYFIGIIAGYELSKIDIDINFSPVVDICENEKDQLLSSRTFGRDRNNIISLATRYITGLMDCGVLPVLKHYPGHGLVNTDSHIQECISDETEDSERFKSHFSVFQYLVKHFNIPIMTSHILFKNIDNNIVTYSKKILNKINEKSLKLFISDDLEMYAAKNKNSHEILPSKRVELALDAGCQFLIITTMLKEDVRQKLASSEYFIDNYLTTNIKNICKYKITRSLTYEDFKSFNRNYKNYHTNSNIYNEAKKNLNGII